MIFAGNQRGKGTFGKLVVSHFAKGSNSGMSRRLWEHGSKILF